MRKWNLPLTYGPKIPGSLHVHHAGRYNLARTVLDEGFLEAFKHPERFETLCRDCHVAKHKDRIESEEKTRLRRGKKAVPGNQQDTNRGRQVEK